jgi:hypothetical protein
MHTLLLTAWLCLPIAPLNPTEQDTLPELAFHATLGFANANGIVSLGPHASVRLETLVIHPLVVRAGIEYRYGTFVSHLFPRGDLNMMSVSSDVLYYRGTNHLTGYLGLGIFYAASGFSANPGTRDSLRMHEAITGITIEPQLGYRFTMGLRVNRRMSIEIAVSEFHPRFKYERRYSSTTYSQYSEATNISSFQVTVGRVWEIIPHRQPHR